MYKHNGITNPNPKRHPPHTISTWNRLSIMPGHQDILMCILVYRISTQAIVGLLSLAVE